jgi:hypothetical protein
VIKSPDAFTLINDQMQRISITGRYFITAGAGQPDTRQPNAYQPNAYQPNSRQPDTRLPTTSDLPKPSFPGCKTSPCPTSFPSSCSSQPPSPVPSRTDLLQLIDLQFIEGLKLSIQRIMAGICTLVL